MCCCRSKSLLRYPHGKHVMWFRESTKVFFCSSSFTTESVHSADGVMWRKRLLVFTQMLASSQVIRTRTTVSGRFRTSTRSASVCGVVMLMVNELRESGEQCHNLAANLAQWCQQAGPFQCFQCSRQTSSAVMWVEEFCLICSVCWFDERHQIWRRWSSAVWPGNTWLYKSIFPAPFHNGCVTKVRTTGFKLKVFTSRSVEGFRSYSCVVFRTFPNKQWKRIFFRWWLLEVWNPWTSSKNGFPSLWFWGPFSWVFSK